MKSVIILINVCLGLLFCNCESLDPCYDVECYNGGVCNNGNCDCPPGFTGTNCETQIPCYDVKCLNGGQCNNNTCVCPTGFEGRYCEKKTPCYWENFGWVTVKNSSKTGKKYAIHIDGALVATLNPRQTSSQIRIKAGKRTLEFKIANSNNYACSKTTINVDKCSYQSWECNG